MVGVKERKTLIKIILWRCEPLLYLNVPNIHGLQGYMVCVFVCFDGQNKTSKNCSNYH